MRNLTLLIAAMLFLGSIAPAVHAQLREDEVLIVYDTRIVAAGTGEAISRDVAEYYAGSIKVPGGAGNLRGIHRGVFAVNLATLGAAPIAPGNITYASFAANLRDPLRNYLTTSGLSRRIRSIVLTRGFPHRILDTDTNDIMDFPGSISNEYFANDVTAASVDAELTLLMQNLDTGENGGTNDSKADGAILNPYWRSASSIAITNNNNNAVSKLDGFTPFADGPVWVSTITVTSPSRLSAGDLYLICRLDGPSLSAIRGMIDRAQNLYINTQTTALLLDESDSNGIADINPNTEYDNTNGQLALLRDSDDYETTRDLLLTDGRWATANVRYNALTGFNQFFIGPRLSWQANHGIMVTTPVMLVASYGLNHLGQPLTTDGTEGGKVYATSYNYVNGAIFNSLESFNCRDFGGLGTLSFAQQQQASAFIAAGGTFATGNVWEPLATSVPDNKYLAQNFILGNLSWAEAAWSAIPALSWMQLVLGDPLARVQRSSDDLNADGFVGIDDLYTWEKNPSDVNRNTVIDSADRLLIYRDVRAAERSTLMTPRS